MRKSPISIRTYLLLAFGTAIASAGISAGTAWWGMTSLTRFVASEQRGNMALAEAVDDMRDDVLQMRRYEKDVFINIDDGQALSTYASKWNRAFNAVRYDLVRARAVIPESEGPLLQQFTDSIATYRSAFLRTFQLIRAGTIQTTQQANEAMSDYKGVVRQTETQLAVIKHRAEQRMSQEEPGTKAQQIGIALNLLLLLAIASLLVVAMRHASVVNLAYAE